MPRYVIERQYLVPMFEHLFVEAPSLDAACREAIDECKQPWGDNVEPAFDSVRAVTITRVVEIPEGVVPELRLREDEDRHTLSRLIYDSDLGPLPVPIEFGEEGEVAEPFGFY